MASVNDVLTLFFQHPGHTSFGMSVFNLSNAIMGSGILGLSYAMANTGIVLFTILLVGVAILSLYSVHLLLLTAKEGGSLIYEKLGERAFGWPGKMAAFGSIIMQNIGAMSSYLFIVKYELPEVIRTILLWIICVEYFIHFFLEWYLNGNYLVVFVSIGIILPLSLLKNLGYLGYTSGFSLSCMVFFLSVVSYIFHDTHQSTGVQYEPHPDEAEMCTPKYFVFNSQTAYTIPILAFAFVCHPEVLPIYSELRDRSRKKMQNVSNLSILAMLIMYMLSALFGYLTFYDFVEAELLHTFTKVYTFDTMLLLVRIAVLTAVTLTVPIVLFPIRSSINTLLFSGREFSWIRHLLIAAAILVFNNMLVIFVPTIRDIFGFIGSSAATMLIFILPAAFYIRLVKSVPLRSPQKIMVSPNSALSAAFSPYHLPLLPAVIHRAHHILTNVNLFDPGLTNSLLFPLLSHQAGIFLIVGIFFMIGSLTLITLDWIHNPPGSNKGH
uniref:Amino acid transporter transmembrane domain-containing protein n=1 Tax=Gouania willdenowi TaxID=441366 RepID=A0A8C5H5D3_GOUWI